MLGDDFLQKISKLNKKIHLFFLYLVFKIFLLHTPQKAVGKIKNRPETSTLLLFYTFIENHEFFVIFEVKESGGFVTLSVGLTETIKKGQNVQFESLQILFKVSLFKMKSIYSQLQS